MSISTMKGGVAFVLALCAVACTTLQREPPETEVHVVYDPAAGRIPLPNDLARDEAKGHLALPVDEGMSKAEVELRQFMNTHDAWPTTFALSAEISGAVDPQTVSADTVLVYEWGDVPKRITDVAIRLDAGDTKIAVDAPLAGWKRGGKYVVAVRGGKVGIRDTDGRGLVPDRAFYFLRAREKLDVYENNRAFPGATREERLAVGAKLEGLRSGLVPYFDGLERQAAPVPREELVALWVFSVTKSAELAMDKASQRMPLPFDLLIDPATKLVSLPKNDKDDTREAAAKAQLNRVNGFGVGSAIDFELTTTIDPRSASTESVRVYEIASGREVKTADVRVLPTEGSAPCLAAVVDPTCRRIMVTLAESELPLKAKTRYAVVVRDRLRTLEGDSVRAMVTGHFVSAKHPLVENGKSQVAALTIENAERLEGVRAEIAPLLEKIGRSDVVAAWPFTTLDAEVDLRVAASLPEQAAYDPQPTVTRHRDVNPGLLDLPGLSEIQVFDDLFPPLVDDVVGTVYVPRVRGVRQVIEGTLVTPNTLDDGTRARRADGGFTREDLAFVLTVPEKPKDGSKVPVVIFGHGLVTDRRFVLMIAGKLAQKGFATIAFDFPFHGLRTRCTHRTLAAIPNFFPEDVRKLTSALKDDILSLPACSSGSTCNRDGRCATADGAVTPFATIPMTDMPTAGGSALIDVEDLPHIPDRMRQALVDMSAVRRALRLADWAKVTKGVELEQHRVFYAGQSLGGILGAVFVSVTDDVQGAVLNVPGADLVGLFRESTYFKPQMDAFLAQEKLVDGSYDQARLLNVARWLMDTVDPQSLAHLLAKKRAILQMSKGDIIIPNRVTERLHRATALPMETYPSPLHGDLVMPVLGDAMLDELVDSLIASK